MLNKLRNNKKGIIQVWVMVLLFLFALGVLYTVFLYVFEGHLIPVITSSTLTTISDVESQNVVLNGISKYMTFFKLMPFILVFVAIVYGIANAIYKQSMGGMN
jgi:Na+-driven multidrug efflux pump